MTDSNSDTYECLRKLLNEEAGVDSAGIDRDTSIRDLGLDSIGLFDMAFSVERRFDIEIPDEAVERVRTVGDLLRLVEDLRARRVPG